MHTWVNRESVVCRSSCGGLVSSSSFGRKNSIASPLTDHQGSTAAVATTIRSDRLNGNSYCAAVSRCSSSPNQASPLSPARSSSAATSAATRALAAAKPCSSCCAAAGCPASAAAHAALYLTSARSEASPSKWGRCSAESAGRHQHKTARHMLARRTHSFTHKQFGRGPSWLHARHSPSTQVPANVPARPMPACVQPSVRHPQSCSLLTVVPQSSSNV